MYWRRPTASELATSFPWHKPEDFIEPNVEVWPELWDGLMLFQWGSTQWRQGPNGPTALDYNVFYTHMERSGWSHERQEETMIILRRIESLALKKIHKLS